MSTAQQRPATPTLAALSPSAGTVGAVATVSTVRTGQPRPYADHENVFRVRFSRVNSYTNTVSPGRYFTRNEADAEDYLQREAALAVLGVSNLPRGKPKDDIWYPGSWVEYVRPVRDSPGEWEIMTKSTYFD